MRITARMVEYNSYFVKSLLLNLFIPIILWVGGVCIYRLYFSPLAKFPGPKLAALTSWYEFYYDVVKGGQFTFHLQSLHKKYGPIIRINPTELHIDDPEYYETIYSNNLRLDKLEHFSHRWNSPGSIQTTAPHDLHRLRRIAVNPFFSKRQISLLWPYILSRCEKLCSRMEEAYDNNTVFPLTSAFGCLTFDVITEYSFGKCANELDSPSLSPEIAKVREQQIGQVHVVTHFPFLLTFMNAWPEWLQRALQPGIAHILHFQTGLENQIRLILDGKEKKAEQPAHKTIFNELLESDLPPQELTLKRLKDEAIVIVGAGTDTVKFALSVASFYILSDKGIHDKLRKELIQAMPNAQTTLGLAELETLPYLSAVIQEGLRLSYGVTQRSPRVSPKLPLQYKNYIIPPGYAVGMDPIHMHHNESVFPNSYKFLPDRWIEKDGSFNKSLKKYNIAFSRGTRQCAGMNLAYAELYLTLSMVFRRFDLELWETDESSVKIEADFFLPQVKPGANGVRARVKRILE
ncbi:cytochrome P450 [Xylogone sp. PMI_703]|nr:cytochrome P450 [Xylogone sp. PMI_703]